MDFEVAYTPEQEAFRTEVRAFLEQRHDPGRLPDRAVEALTPEQNAYVREIGLTLGERGWLHPTYPREYSGGGLDVDHAVVIEEEMHRLGMRLPPYYDSGGRLAGASILVWGTEQQKRFFLPLIFGGRISTWQLMSEPSAGSDVAAVSSRAVKDGDSYVLNGQKTFVGSAYPCEWHFTLMNTDPSGPRHRNLSWFMVDASLPGITIQPLEMLTANHGEGMPQGNKNAVFFDDVRVPASCLIGGENNAWQVNTTAMELEHGGGGGIGRSKAATWMLEYLRGQAAGSVSAEERRDQMDSLADLFIDAEITRLFGLRNYFQSANDIDRSYEGSQYSMQRKTSDPRIARH
ncbi:MAG: acyl-CoA dehydrogenase family protein, partial [Chloroflexota bacterium]